MNTEIPRIDHPKSDPVVFLGHFSQGGPSGELFGGGVIGNPFISQTSLTPPAPQNIEIPNNLSVQQIIDSAANIASSDAIRSASMYYKSNPSAELDVGSEIIKDVYKRLDALAASVSSLNDSFKGATNPTEFGQGQYIVDQSIKGSEQKSDATIIDSSPITHKDAPIHDVSQQAAHRITESDNQNSGLPEARELSVQRYPSSIPDEKEGIKSSVIQDQSQKSVDAFDQQISFNQPVYASQADNVGRIYPEAQLNVSEMSLGLIEGKQQQVASASEMPTAPETFVLSDLNPPKTTKYDDATVYEEPSKYTETSTPDYSENTAHKHSSQESYEREKATANIPSDYSSSIQVELSRVNNRIEHEAEKNPDVVTERNRSSDASGVEVELRQGDAEQDMAMEIKRRGRVNEETVGWSGRVFVGGKLLLNNPNWRVSTTFPAYVEVRIGRTNVNVFISTGVMPTTFPVDAEFYDLEQTFGDIHCDRF